MSSKRAGQSAIANLLRADNFGGNQSGSKAIALPITPTMMRLSLDDIVPYDKNPRKSQNVRFEEIINSIIDKGGVTATISVTKRPTDTHFMVSAGGNTRLEAQREAFHRTQREDLAMMNVMFIPYVGEVNLLVDHLIENEMRSDNSFIEKALALQEIMNLVRRERQVDDLSQRQWVGLLKEEYQYTVSRTVFFRYLYALEKLLPAIPKALFAGASKNKVEAINKLETRIRKFANSQAIDDATFDIVFQQALTDCDTDVEFVINDLESALLDQLGSMMGGQSRAQLITAMEMVEHGVQVPTTAGATIEGTLLNPSEPQPAVGDPPSFSEGVDSKQVAAGFDVPTLEDQTNALPENQSGWGFSPDHEDSMQDDHGSIADAPSVSDSMHQVAEPARLPQPSSIDKAGDLSTLRHHATRQAKAIATHVSIAPLVRLVDFGYGYFLDLPDTELQHPDEITAWWLLTSLSDIFGGQESHSLLPDNSALKQVLIRAQSEAQFFEDIQPLVGSPSFGHIGNFFTDPTFPIGDYSQLVSTLQSLRQHPISTLWMAEGV